LIPVAREVLNASKSCELFKSSAANFWFVVKLALSNQRKHFLEFDPETNSPPLAVDCYQGMLYGSRFSIHIKKDQ
jgi:hypothetical protein